MIIRSEVVELCWCNYYYYYFLSEQKWLDEKQQVLTAASDHVERLKIEKEKLSEHRWVKQITFQIVASSVISLMSCLWRKIQLQQPYEKCLVSVMHLKENGLKEELCTGWGCLQLLNKMPDIELKYTQLVHMPNYTSGCLSHLCYI